MMRSLFTPSRVAVVVITLSLISFFWTFGLPRPLAQPSSPIIEHPADEVKLHDPIVPVPVPETSAAKAPAVTPTPAPPGDRPQEADDHRWEDKTKKPAQPDKQTILPGPEETGPAGHDDDGGRWNDKEKGKESSKTATSQVAVSATPKPVPESVFSGNFSNALPTPTFSEPPIVHTPVPVTGFCKDVHNAEHVMVVIKTSKAESSDKLSAHLSGLLSCVPNFAIFSDHAGEIDGTPIYDALHDISAEAKQKHEEFREYSIIRADPAYKPNAKKTKDLDKWKILPMVYKAYQMNPHARFYAFIEADTGLSWTNILQWVDRLDYRIPYYSGAQTYINQVQFAQRGPGILLSQGALRRYAKSYDERWASEWEARVAKECCGDYVLATALNDAHVELYTSWPLIQGEQPNTLDYTNKQWCAPAVSWHHMDTVALTKNWDLQKQWTEKHGWDKPYLYRDAFTDYISPQLESQLENWDNLGSDTQIKAPAGRQTELKASSIKDDNHDAQATKSALEAVAALPYDNHPRDDKKSDKQDWAKIATLLTDGADSPSSCQKVCTEVEDCLQWRYTTKGDGECHLSKVVKLGRYVGKKEGGENWTSGWMVERIRGVVKGWECKEVKWKFYQ